MQIERDMNKQTQTQRKFKIYFIDLQIEKKENYQKERKGAKVGFNNMGQSTSRSTNHSFSAVGNKRKTLKKYFPSENKTKTEKQKKILY